MPFSHFAQNDIPQFHTSQVWALLSRLDTNKATVPGDFPARLIKNFAAYLAEPLTDIYNTSLLRGYYPQIYKFEVSTPVPKRYPTESVSHLRNISGLITFDKVFEKLLAQLIVSDMEANMDPAQFGNQKSISIQHYLIQMIHRIVTVLDRNSRRDIFAICCKYDRLERCFPSPVSKARDTIFYPKWCQTIFDPSSHQLFSRQ